MAPGRSRGADPPQHFVGPCWEPFWTKSRQKGIQKGMQNLMSKKYRKWMPKGYQNDAKIETQIHEQLYFYGKGWNARNYLFYNRKRGSGHLRCMKIRYKIDAKSMPEKAVQKVWKIMPKLRPNGGQDRLKIQKICEKRHGENRCWNLMLKKRQIPILR